MPIQQMSKYGSAGSATKMFYNQMALGGNGDFQHLVESVIPESSDGMAKV
jgi:hypothetical protein